MKAKRCFYDVFKNGELIGQDIPSYKTAQLIGMKNTGDVHAYASGKRLYKGVYKIVTVREEPIIKKIHIPHPVEFNTSFDEEMIKEWNEVTTAARLIKTGHGKIVTRNGKKCTVMI